MLDPRIAREVLARALSQGGMFAEIFLEDRLSHTVTMRSAAVETINAGRSRGAGVRVFHQLRCVYACTSDTSRTGLLDCAEKAAAAVRAARTCDPAAPSETPTPNIHAVRRYPGDTAHKDRVAVLREGTLAAQALGGEIAQVQATYTDWDQRVCVANSEGLLKQDRRVYSRVLFMAVASDGKENQTGYVAPGAMGGIEIFKTTVDPAACGREAAETALRMLHAPVCPAGTMPVVMYGGFGGVVFHEACGHSLEATSVARGQSEFCGKLGQKVASDRVTAIDDGTEAGSWGSLNMDDEGAPTQKNILIENGVLKGYLIDKLNGLRMGMEPTGSGRRQNYTFAPTSRMTNTYIAAGTDDDDEMIRTMGDGLLATKMGGGSVDPATGVFNFAVSEGYLVKGGKVDTPVRGASLIGRGSEVLLKIDRVGKTLTSAQGMCGSRSGSVPTNVGQPRIRISDITVGGR